MQKRIFGMNMTSKQIQMLVRLENQSGLGMNRNQNSFAPRWKSSGKGGMHELLPTSFSLFVTMLEIKIPESMCWWPSLNHMLTPRPGKGSASDYSTIDWGWRKLPKRKIKHWYEGEIGLEKWKQDDKFSLECLLCTRHSAREVCIIFIFTT